MNQGELNANLNQPSVSTLVNYNSKANVIMVLGILSIVFCWFYGITGLAIGVIARNLAKNSEKLYATNPPNYTEKNMKTIKAGKICANTGIILSAIFFMLLLIKLFISLIIN
jgi:preprotein translocase subunit SecY